MKITHKFNEKAALIALDSLVESYYSDLKHITNFRKFINEDDPNYSKSFRNFLLSYNVLRNIKKGKYLEFENEVKIFIQNRTEKEAPNILAKSLKDKNITDKYLLSLLSKVLFLNNPALFLPIDQFSRKGVERIFHAKINKDYSEFIDYVNIFRLEFESTIKEFIFRNCLFDNSLKSVDDIFKYEIDDLEKVKLNRFIDKYLMVFGGN